MDLSWDTKIINNKRKLDESDFIKIKNIVPQRAPSKKGRGTWWAQTEKHATLDLGVVSSSPMER